MNRSINIFNLLESSLSQNIDKYFDKEYNTEADNLVSKFKTIIRLPNYKMYENAYKIVSNEDRKKSLFNWSKLSSVSIDIIQVAIEDWKDYDKENEQSSNKFYNDLDNIVSKLNTYIKNKKVYSLNLNGSWDLYDIQLNRKV